MSFILDALQKADRERDLARVPGLRTVHAASPPRARRYGLWALPVAFLVGAGVSVWFLIPSPRVQPPAGGDSPGGDAARQPGRAGDLHRALARLEAALAPPSGPEAPAPARPGSDTRRQAPGRSARKEPADTPPSTAAPPAPADLRPPQGDRPRELSPEERSAVGRPALPQGEPPASGAQGAPAPGVAAPQPVQSPAPPQSTEVRTEARTQPPPPPTDHTAALLEAIAKMKLGVFVYADVRDKRMVVIDGRKYAEGDQVDGRYLLEAITNEGAVLSHGGARAILRP